VYVGPGGVVASTPAVVVYPDYYVWDGVEYVGLHGDRYFYLNAGGVWVDADPVILSRFRGWERYHPDWRRTATRYSPGQHIEPRGRAVENRDRAVEHREVEKKAPAHEDKKAPASQAKKTPPPQTKKAAPTGKKEEPPKSN
jgi:hypothetical protein